ncbi:hypothetical protein [Limosilactobacillus oris]|uniref:hypothetical protein n=1 Tax=Limosilactobacillus oris TaxID=1632 RepID=UPI0024B344BE|nr:hypothetical protein [Limosilactobacillus oris]WHO86473.1 hypothetical protein QLX69_04530 [Limosilactobacillus oris]
MSEKVNANEVIAELQNEIADKALTIALLKSQLKDAKKNQAPETKPADAEQPTEGDEQ